MRNQPETVHEYNIPRLNWWFLISGALFVGCLILMIWVDYSGGEIHWLGLRGDRGWKNYQREYYKVDRQRLKADAQAAEARANEAGLQKMQDELKKVAEELTGKKGEEAKLQTGLEESKVTAGFVMREFTMEKALRDQYRSFYEAALERNGLNEQAAEVRDWREKVDDQNRKVDRLQLRKQEVDAAAAEAQAQLDAVIGHEEELQRKIKRLEDSQNLLTKRLRELSDPLIQTVVNAPVVEFAASTYRVEQIVAEDHHVDVNFTTVPRVDRCITCHKAIEKKDPTPEELQWRAKHKIDAVVWSKLPQPLNNHPQMDLFVSDTSPHPASKYGCTVCHWGWDRETDFSRAGHTPDEEAKHPYTFDSSDREWVRVTAEEDADEDAPKKVAAKKIVEMTQKAVWIKNHDWEHQEFLTQPMRAKKYVQASCLKCHTESTDLKGAEKLDHGRRLVEQLGCWSCHKMKQAETYSLHTVAPGEDFDSICKFYDVNPDEVRQLNSLPREVTLTAGKELNIPIRTLRKPGPSLYKVASKTDREWMRKWLNNPVAFRPNTYMPKFWGLDNNQHTPDRNAVEMNAITEFLFAVSEQPDYPELPVQGDVEKGKALVGQLGCMGCHVIDEKLMDMKVPKQLAAYMDEWDYRRLRSQGPQLAGTGSKAKKTWLFMWLKNPKQYHPQTKMPDLRLSDQEAADIAEYLATLRREKTDKETLPEVKDSVLNDVTLEYLQVTLPQAEALKKINELDEFIEPYFVDEWTMKYYQQPALLARDEMQLQALQKEYEETFDDALQRKADQLAARLQDVKSRMDGAKKRVATFSDEQKKNIYLGSKLISRYGCFACHNIHGYEAAKPIGVELSEWGSKPVDKLDFGLIEIEKDRIAWLKQKLRAPRSYDIGRIDVTRSPQEYLRMSKFNLTDEQIDQIVTVVTGMTDEKLTPNEPKHLTPAEFQIERGRWVVKELNCKGCHQIEGKGWAIRATDIPQGLEPPMVSGLPTQLRQGQRTQPDWLFSFLNAPQTGQIRPWLKVRMPTFHLSDAEANVLVRYFALDGRTRFPYQTPQVVSTPEHLAAGKELFEQLKCALCHIVEGKALGKPLEEIPEEDLPRLAPNLSLAHKRLQRDWLINKWLPEPLAQVPGTRMPQFEYGPGLAPSILGGDGRKQTEALVDYVLSLGAAHDQEQQPASDAGHMAASAAE